MYVSGLREYDSLAEDQSSVPCTHDSQLPTVYNSNSSGAGLLKQHIYMCIYTHKYTRTQKIYTCILVLHKINHKRNYWVGRDDLKLPN